MKKKIIIGIIAGVTLLGASIFLLTKCGTEDKIVNNEKIVEDTSMDLEDKESILEFIKSIEGVELTNLKIISNPIGFKGEAFVPDESVVNGINYFLEETNNDKMSNIKIQSKDEHIVITVDYEVMWNLKTPIELNIKPTLNSNNDILITVDEVKFLDIKIADWIVDMALGNFIEDWFSNTDEYDIDFNDGDITIYKDNFKEVEVTNIFLDEGLNIEVIIKLDNIL